MSYGEIVAEARSLIRQINDRRRPKGAKETALRKLRALEKQTGLSLYGNVNGQPA